MRREFLAVLLAGLVLTSGVSVLAGEAAPPAPAEPTAEEAEPAPPKKSAVAQYFGDRWKDFLDIFNLKLALGDGASFLVHVRPTRFLQLGVGRFAGTKVGFDGPSAGVFGEGRVEAGASIFYWAWIGRRTADEMITKDAIKTNRFFGNVDDIMAGSTYRLFYDANRPWHTVGGAFALPFLPGLEAELNPAEAIDFLLSFANHPGLRVPPPFRKKTVEGEKVPDPYSIRWHGHEELEKYD
ncbi:MAG: hypothetical protein ACOC8A_01050 [bacterium]